MDESRWTARPAIQLAGRLRRVFSQSNVAPVQRYIEGQEKHHRKMSFQDELRALFKRHGVEFDERYVWD